MRTLLYSDATLDGELDLERFANQMNKIFAPGSFVVGRAKFEIPSRIVSHPESYMDLPPRLVGEVDSVNADLTILMTAKRYDNNYFWDMQDNVMILSFYAWDYLTSLSFENGLAYFWASKALDRICPTLNHDASTGCISDFLWLKSGVDVGMRAAYLCKECAAKIDSMAPGREQRDLMELVSGLLDRLSLASRAEKNVVEYLEDTNLAEELFDVFLCHNSEDKPEVRKIAVELRHRSLNPWLDEDQLQPGRPWQVELERQILQVKSVAVCLGSTGRGPWQSMELLGFLSAFVERDCPVIPVVLPGAEPGEVPELPVFLRQFTWVDFRQEHPDPWARLCYGITGNRM